MESSCESFLLCDTMIYDLSMNKREAGDVC